MFTDTDYYKSWGRIAGYFSELYSAIFFVVPLLLAGMFSAFGIGKITAIVEEFLNMHISTNIGVTVLMFLIVYGGYFIATYLSCKHMVMEKQIEELEV